MAAMTTVLTEFSQNGNSRTSTYAGHTAVEPRLVIEKRRVPEGNQTTLSYSAKVVSSTADVDGAILKEKVIFEASVQYPLSGASADVAAALAIFRDIVAGDEFGNSVITQNWL